MKSPLVPDSLKILVSIGEKDLIPDACGCVVLCPGHPGLFCKTRLDEPCISLGGNMATYCLDCSMCIYQKVKNGYFLRASVLQYRIYRRNLGYKPQRKSLCNPLLRFLPDIEKRLQAIGCEEETVVEPEPP